MSRSEESKRQADDKLDWRVIEIAGLGDPPNSLGPSRRRLSMELHIPPPSSSFGQDSCWLDELQS